MAKLIGFNVFLWTTVIFLHCQMAHAGVMRNKEQTTPQATEQTESATSQTVTDSDDNSTPQDGIAQTTVPPILFREETFHPSDDNSSTEDAATTTFLPDTEKEQTSSERAFFEPSRNVSSRAEPPLDREPTLAHASSVDSDASLVSSDELVPYDELLPNRSDMGVLARDNMEVTTEESPAERGTTEGEVEATTEALSQGETEEPLPTQNSNESEEETTKIHSEPHTTTNKPVAETPGEDVKKEELTSDSWVGIQIHPKEPRFSDSFIPPAVQIMAHVIEKLWVKEKHSFNEEKNPFYDSEPKDEKRDTGETNTNDDDDDMRKIEEDVEMSNMPVFQTNVPVVNEESVPMKMTMDIIPADHPEDLEGFIMYPTGLEDYSDDMGDSSVSDDPDLQDIHYPAHPWGSDHRIDGDLSSLLGGDAEDIEEDIVEKINLYLRLQAKLRAIRYSDTFDRLVQIHKDLAFYAKSHNVNRYKGYSDRVMDILQRTATTNAAEQLRTVTARVLDESKITDASLEKKLKELLNDLSDSAKDVTLNLSRIPAVRYS